MHGCQANQQRVCAWPMLCADPEVVVYIKLYWDVDGGTPSFTMGTMFKPHAYRILPKLWRSSCASTRGDIWVSHIEIAHEFFDMACCPVVGRHPISVSAANDARIFAELFCARLLLPDTGKCAMRFVFEGNIAHEFFVL